MYGQLLENETCPYLESKFLRRKGIEKSGSETQKGYGANKY